MSKTKNPLFLIIILCIVFPLLSAEAQETTLPANKRCSLKNVSYGPEIRHSMDVVLPKNRNGKNTPVIIFIHGGAWIVGNKLFFHREMKQFAEKGFACVCINYRYVSNTKGIHHQEITSDILRSINFVRQHAQTWNISPDNIGLMGHSAGGHLSMIVAYALDTLHLIKAMVSWSGPTNFLDPLQPSGQAEGQNILKMYTGTELKTAADTAVWKSVSPYYRVKSNSVPTLLVQGELDNLVPAPMAMKMHNRLDSLGVKNDLLLLKNTGHIYVNAGLEKARKASLDWMKEYLTPQENLKITPLTGNYYVYTTWNTYKNQRVSSNSMYLVTTEGVVVIDTPWDSTQFKPLIDSIWERHHQKVVLCISTHSHADRTAGLEFLKQQGVKTYTSFLTDEECKAKNEKRAEFHFKDDTTFHVGQYTFQTYYGGAGHTKDNLVVWFPDAKVLYGGCLIKSTDATDLGNVKDADLVQYPLTLEKIKQKFPDRAFVIPGHQSWSDPKSIDHTLELLKLDKR
jgi:metallo-beta-lactamase class B